MRRSLWIMGVAALALTLAVGQVMARQGRGGPRDGRHSPLAALDLTSEQRAQLDALRTQHQEAMKPLFAEMRAAHEAMAALAEKEDATVEQAEAAEQRLVDARLALSRAKRAHRQEALQVLTPEQRAEVPVAWRLALGPGHHGKKFGHYGPGFGRKGGKGFGPGAGKGFGPGAGKGGPWCPCAGEGAPAETPDE